MTSVAPRNVNGGSYMTKGSTLRVIFRGRNNTWRIWKVSHVAPRIVNDVSCVTPIHDESNFSWRAQYMVMFEDNCCCSAHGN